MTSHFTDLTLRGDEETSVREVLEIVFARLHLALTRSLPSGVGLSFPAATRPGAFTTTHSLGNVVRLHGSAEALRALLASPWTSNLADHLVTSPIASVPIGASPIRLVRVQAKSNTDRLVRRAVKRRGLTEMKAREAYAGHAQKRLALPYLSVRSASTKQSFRLYVHQEPAAEPRPGTFSAYGLSVPGGPTVWAF